MCRQQSALNISRRDPNSIFATTGVKTALARYKIDMGDYPSSAEGWQALITAPTGNGNMSNWSGPYLLDFPSFLQSPKPCEHPLQYLLWRLTPNRPPKPTKEPLDSWGRPFRYAYPGRHNSTLNTSAGASGTTPTVRLYDVWSLGPDGIDGTADDIGNW